MISTIVVHFTVSRRCSFKSQKGKEKCNARLLILGVRIWYDKKVSQTQIKYT